MSVQKQEQDVKLHNTYQDTDQQIHHPKVTEKQLPDLVWRLYGLKINEFKSLPSYYDLNFYFQTKEPVDNANITEVNEHCYVLKILNSHQSSQPEIIDAQHSLKKLLREGGIPTQVPQMNRDGQHWSQETFTVDGEEYGPYIVQLLTYIPGETMADTPYISGSFYNIGKFIANFHKQSKGFHHSFYDTYSLIWSLLELPVLRNFIHAVTDDKDDTMVREVIAAYEDNVVPKFEKFTKGVIHGDINEQNIVMFEVPGQTGIIPEERVHDVCAILDFTDATKSYNIMDVAINITYMSLECPEEDQLDVGGHVLAGYCNKVTLNDSEFSSLKILICARLCQSLVIGAHTNMLQPENTNVLATSKRGWHFLRKLWKTDQTSLYSRWTSIMDTYKSK